MKTTKTLTKCIAILGMMLFIQGCGDSGLESNSSAQPELQVEFDGNDGGTGTDNGGTDNGGTDNGGTDNGGTDNGGNTGGNGGTGGNPTDPFTFTFNINSGDNVTYVNDEAGDLGVSSIFRRGYYTLQDSTVYFPLGQEPNVNLDLPTGYCANSALPACNYINQRPCSGFGCTDYDRPVQCHRETRLAGDAFTDAFATLNGVRFLSRVLLTGETQVADCDNPNLSFNASASSLNISLADRTCVAEGGYVASAGGDAIRTLFDTELDAAANAGSMCNLYANYSFDTTRFTYRSNSGLVPIGQRESVTLTYENQLADIIFMEVGDTDLSCADDVYVNPPGVEDFFPSNGINYEVVRSASTALDRATGSITYSDVLDNGLERRFFLNGQMAADNHGGASLDATQSAAIQARVAILIQRAKDLGLVRACN